MSKLNSFGFVKYLPETCICILQTTTEVSGFYVVMIKQVSELLMDHLLWALKHFSVIFLS